MKRLSILDGIRGLTIVSMVLYHAVWDLVYIYQLNWKWYQTDIAYLWQQSICWTFILLSGFCWSLGRKKGKRGLVVLLSGTLITGVTLLFMPENRIVFGVLTMLGSSMLLMVPLQKWLKKSKPVIGGGISAFLFLVLRNVNDGYLGFGNWNLFRLPENLYSNMLTTYLGFPLPDFYSSDYFSILPWFFLFLTGYYFYRILEDKDLLKKLQRWNIPGMDLIGKHSMEVYLIHQPILFVVLEWLY